MMFAMFSTVVPWAVVVAAIVLHVNQLVSFDDLTIFSRRCIPRRPPASKNFDCTGGFKPWLKGQILISCIIANILFCLCTGQLEAWWELLNQEECSAPGDQIATFKYPACGLNLTSNSLDFDEAAGLTGIPVTNIMAMNDTCWQDSRPVQLCPFATTGKVGIANWISSSQWVHRIAGFILIDRVQSLLAVCLTSYFLSALTSKAEKDAEVAIRQQHVLMAEQLVPQSSTAQPNPGKSGFGTMVIRRSKIQIPDRSNRRQRILASLNP